MIFERGHFRNNIISKSHENELLNESRTFSWLRHQSEPTVLLSHKHYDDRDVEHRDLREIIQLLENSGAKVYIDSMDSKMPGVTSGETAKRIKEAIRGCDKFILFATEEAIDSFWCSWELGIGDIYKYMDHIAILPMKNNGTTNAQYKGNEYLQIYPSIDYEDGTDRTFDTQKLIPEGYYFCRPKNDKNIILLTPLERWLKE